MQAAKAYNIDLTDSYMIGDNECDIIAGKTAGCKTILVETDGLYGQTRSGTSLIDIVMDELRVELQ